MADNDQDNEEYKFEEHDSMDNMSMGDTSDDMEQQEASKKSTAIGQTDVRRNALIAVGVVLLIIVIYKIWGSLSSGKTAEVKSTIPAAIKVASQPVITPAPIAPIPTVMKETDTELKQKVSDIELNEQGIKSEVSSVKDQLDTVNNNVNNLNEQIAKLNQVIGDLSNQVVKQSNIIALLMARAQPKKVKPVHRYSMVENINYNVKAVIPGRAWLIGSNGSTLTVRVGTIIHGYGEVKLIDSIQGRVLTSSGRVIRFSQDDS